MYVIKINRILDWHAVKLFCDQKQNPAFCCVFKPGMADSMYSLYFPKIMNHSGGCRVSIILLGSEISKAVWEYFMHGRFS